jgi:hypothetical protein
LRRKASELIDPHFPGPHLPVGKTSNRKMWARKMRIGDSRICSLYHCKLRVAVDTIISTGYFHTEADHPSSDPDIDWLDLNRWPNRYNAI